MIPDNGICHIEIPAVDLEGVAAFYETVFKWKIQRGVPHETYWFFDSGNICGAFTQKSPEGKDIKLYIKSADIDASLAAVKEAGGAVEREKESLPNNYGFDGEFTDPAGNRMGLWAPAEDNA